MTKRRLETYKPLLTPLQVKIFNHISQLVIEYNQPAGCQLATALSGLIRLYIVIGWKERDISRYILRILFNISNIILNKFEV